MSNIRLEKSATGELTGLRHRYGRNNCFYVVDLDLS